MKNLITLVAIWLCFLICAGLSAQNESIVVNSPNIKLNLVNQNPYPAEPGSKVDVLFKLENYGGVPVENLTLEILESFPFKIDPSTGGFYDVGILKGLQTKENAQLIKFTLNVDKNAPKGDNTLKVRYGYKVEGYPKVYYEKEFKINVKDPKTDFEVILQEMDNESLTLALVNTGANPASATIVKIMDANDIIELVQNSQVIGTLDPGEYTLASFSFSRILKSGNISIEITYTDQTSERRAVYKKIEIKPELSKRQLKFLDKTATKSDWTYISVGGLGILGILFLIFIYKKMRR
ncbi:MAG: hypothetical protein QW097_02505 [archaeon]